MSRSDLQHLIAFIKLEVIRCFVLVLKRHKIKGKVISLYLAEINDQEAPLLFTEHSSLS